jgi:plasmid stabilization system protein ParE
VRLSVHPEAQAEFLRAVQFYSQESARAPIRFIDEVEAAYAEITEFPNRYSLYDRVNRVKQLHDFPFSIIYRATDDVVRVLAVAHGKRRPGYWQKRK